MWARGQGPLEISEIVAKSFCRADSWLAALRSAGTGPATLYRVDVATGAAAPFNGTANPANSVIGPGGVAVPDIAVLLK
ncbi:hypothetical protein [Massilia genomosp. 1]|uniref:Uncharacterized protein n=1 Tax=Massilia genomosp. 1 TaxID=2609280 RepID=A0ABX0MKQ3_9BURK|nr:hypothetical protein [Massilia genomosp. 1]NHZ63375.1 hypothetical protein [Massilia genomosp. 1]